MATSSGHIFVLRGDIRRLACDAWAMPSDGEGRIEPSWVAWPPNVARGLGPPVPFAHWTREGRRVRRLEGWPTHLPEPWLLHVELDPMVPSSWLVEAATAFVREAAAGLKGQRPRHGRKVPLLALPVGVAGIGAADGRRARRAAGALVRELLPELRAAAAERGVDVAIVAHSDDSLAGAQAARQPDEELGLRALPEHLRAALPALQAAVRRRSLVLVSGPALAERVGLPSWTRLLERLAEAAAAPEGWRRALASLPEDERTRLVARHMGGTSAFARAAAERLTLAHHGLAHGLAAGLGAELVIGLSPDDLLEQAFAATGRPADVILDGPISPGGARLVRLMGAPTLPSSLLWARVDADWRRERESSLSAVAQAAMPAEPHLLVLGLADPPGLLRVLRALAPALGAGGAGTVTVLAERDDPDLAALLPEGARFVPLIPSTEPRGPEVRQAGRHLELLLDILGSAAAIGGRFLDPGLRGLLPASDQALARALDDLVVGLPGRARQGEGWAALRRWLAARGHPDE